MWSETVLGQDRSETKKNIGLGLVHCGLGLAVLVLFCETRSCNARRHSDLEGHNNFSSMLFMVSLFCAWNISLLWRSTVALWPGSDKGLSWKIHDGWSPYLPRVAARKRIVYSFVFLWFLCVSPSFYVSMGMQLSLICLTVFGVSVTNLSEPPRALAISTITWVRSQLYPFWAVVNKSNAG